MRRNQFTRRPHPPAFTLIELLVVMGILGVLGALLMHALGGAKQRAAMINEINSARQLMIAWQLYADDHSGNILPGYRYGYRAVDRLGQSIEHPISARYPWRLAPYLANNFEVLYVNRNRGLLHEFAQADNARYTYAASVFPSLGINSIFVGGDDLVLPPGPQAYSRYGRFCVLNTAEIHRPTELIAFASAQGRFDGKVVNGFYRVEPPYLAKRIWAATWDESMPPEQLGFVHPRYNRHAVVALTDGHAETTEFEALQDMRRWSNIADRPDWTLRRSDR